MSTAIVEVQTAVAEFDKVAAGIADLQKQYAGVVYEVATTKGMAEAKAARAAIREPRFEIERVRKEAKAPLLKLGKELDSRAAIITDQILAIEEPIDKQVKSEEARKEAEKQAKIDAELKRVQDIQNRIEAIRSWPANAAGKPSSLVSQMLQSAMDYQIDTDTFQEFVETATTALVNSRAAVQGIHAERVAHEAEQERIKTERAELELLRAEQAKREKAERERIAEEECKAKVERDAETARQAEALRKERASFERTAALENARIKAQREEDERAVRERQIELDRHESERLATTRLENERTQMALQEIQAIQYQAIIATAGRLGVRNGGTRECIVETLAETNAWVIDPEHFGLFAQTAQKTKDSTVAAINAALVQFDAQVTAEADRQAREAEERWKAEQARIAALKRPSDGEIIEVLAAHYRSPPEKIVEWLRTLDLGAPAKKRKAG